MLALLGAALLGALAGALVGIVIVDYTDANASHAAVDIAIVAVGALAGLLVAILLRRPPMPEPAPPMLEQAERRDRHDEQAWALPAADDEQAGQHRHR